MKTPRDLPRLFTIRDVSERLNISTKTVRRLIESKALVAHRIGGQLRIADDDLLAYIRMRREG